MIKFSDFIKIYEQVATQAPAAPVATSTTPSSSTSPQVSKSLEFLSKRYKNINLVKQNVSQGKRKSSSTNTSTNTNNSAGLKLDEKTKNITIEGENGKIYDLSYSGSVSSKDKYFYPYYIIKSDDPTMSKYQNIVVLDNETYKELVKSINIINKWKTMSVSTATTTTTTTNQNNNETKNEIINYIKFFEKQQQNIDQQQNVTTTTPKKQNFNDTLFYNFASYEKYPNYQVVKKCIDDLKNKYPDLYKKSFADIYKSIKDKTLINKKNGVWYIQKFSKENRKHDNVVYGSELKIGDYIQFAKGGETTESFKIKNIQQKTNTPTTVPTI